MPRVDRYLFCFLESMHEPAATNGSKPPALQPDPDQSLTLSLWRRHSRRGFAARDISPARFAEFLCATNSVNRTANDRCLVPAAMLWHEMDA